MAYTPTIWSENDIITAEKLNNIEGEIYNNSVNTLNLGDWIDLSEYIPEEDFNTSLEKGLSIVVSLDKEHELVSFLKDNFEKNYNINLCFNLDETNGTTMSFLFKEIQNTKMFESELGAYYKTFSLDLNNFISTPLQGALQFILYEGSALPSDIPSLMLYVFIKADFFSIGILSEEDLNNQEVLQGTFEFELEENPYTKGMMNPFSQNIICYELRDGYNSRSTKYFLYKTHQDLTSYNSLEDRPENIYTRTDTIINDTSIEIITRELATAGLNWKLTSKSKIIPTNSST